MTNINSCGYVATSKRKLARDIEVDVETLKSALEKMFKENVLISEDGVWLKNYIGEQLGSGGRDSEVGFLLSSPKKGGYNFQVTFTILPEENDFLIINDTKCFIQCDSNTLKNARMVNPTISLCTDCFLLKGIP